jgi:hypothetical protein
MLALLALAIYALTIPYLRPAGHPAGISADA